jgi:hypothetical protein
MAQQAVPKGSGQSEFFRAQLAISLTLVVKKLSPTAESIAILYSFSGEIWATGKTESAMVIVILQARSKSYRSATSESNLTVFSAVS